MNKTTSHLEHETLALATLLNLDFQDSSFAQAELLKLKAGESKEQKLDEMMRDFWLVLERNSPGAIPPGIIFLPGDRIQERGFGWAPRSWMSAQGVDHPDPISVVSKSATLEPLGLLVEFPGFLLHFEDRHAILGHQGFWFPSDSSLSEWYRVKWADAGGQEYSITKGNKLHKEELAVILSRPRPREDDEIGLLVEIHKTEEHRDLAKDSIKRTFAVHILGRVNIKRETDENQVKEKKKEIIESRKSEYRNKIICGEALDEDQQWYVDSRTPIDKGVGEESKAPLRSPSGAHLPAIGRSKPYGMRGAPEDPVHGESEVGTSHAGSEDPEPAQGSNQNLARNNAKAASQEEPSEQPQKPKAASTHGTHDGNIPTQGVKRSRTEQVLGKLRFWDRRNPLSLK